MTAQLETRIVKPESKGRPPSDKVIFKIKWRSLSTGITTDYIYAKDYMSAMEVLRTAVYEWGCEAGFQVYDATQIKGGLLLAA